MLDKMKIILFLLIVYSVTLNASYLRSITLASFQLRENAVHCIEKLETEKKYHQVRKLQKELELELKVKKVKKFYVVKLGLLQSQEDVEKVMKTLVKFFPDAYVKKEDKKIEKKIPVKQKVKIKIVEKIKVVEKIKTVEVPKIVTVVKKSEDKKYKYIAYALLAIVFLTFFIAWKLYKGKQQLQNEIERLQSQQDTNEFDIGDIDLEDIDIGDIDFDEELTQIK